MFCLLTITISYYFTVCVCVCVCVCAGYTAAHFAAAWGQVDCLRVLANNGADMLLKNFHDETPRDIAKRYEKYPCIQYMDWAGSELINDSYRC